MPLTDLAPTDAHRAVGVVDETGCKHFKADCYSYRYLAATDDGGRTWHPIGG